MTRGELWAAFRAEADRLCGELSALSDEDFQRPTRCTPWTVAELLAHVRTATGRPTGMLAAPPPATAALSTLDYYRPDERFSAEANDRRVDAARREAAEAGSGQARRVQRSDEITTARGDDIAGQEYAGGGYRTH